MADPYRLVRLHSANGEFSLRVPRDKDSESGPLGPRDPSRIRDHRTLVRFNPSDYGLRRMLDDNGLRGRRFRRDIEGHWSKEVIDSATCNSDPAPTDHIRPPLYINS